MECLTLLSICLSPFMVARIMVQARMVMGDSGSWRVDRWSGLYSLPLVGATYSGRLERWTRLSLLCWAAVCFVVGPTETYIIEWLVMVPVMAMWYF